MRFEQCPLCTAPVEVTVYPGGFLLVRCHECGAGWEKHGAMTRRLSEAEVLAAAPSR